MSQVIAIGNSNTDFVCFTNRLPIPGETVTGISYSTYAGGKAANQAVAAVRSGANVQFVGCVGTDDIGQARLEDLTRASVGVDFVRRVADQSSGIALIIVDLQGENQIVVVPGANQYLDVEHVRDVCRKADAGTVVSLTLESPFEVADAIVQEFAGNLRIICNAAPFDERIVGLAAGIDHLILNEVEATQLIGKDVTAENSHDAIQHILRLGFHQVVITLGAQGALSGDREGIIAIPAIEANVIDTTGAGDAFCGVFAAWLAQNESIENAVMAGVAAGSLSVRKQGAQISMPERAEIIKVINSLSANR